MLGEVEMRLNNKVILTLGIVWIIFLGISYLGAHEFLMTGFLKLEKEQVSKNLVRVHQSINQISYALGTFTSDWGYWNDAYNYVDGKNPQFVKNNIDINALANSNINLLLYLNKQGQILIGLAVDLKNKKQIAYPKGLEKYIYPGSPLEIHPTPVKNIRGLIALESGIMLVAAAGTASTDSSKPINGSIITGRVFSKEVLKTIAENTSLELNLYFPADIQKNKTLATSFDNAIKNQSDYDIAILDDKIVYGYTVLRDINHQPIGLIRVTMPRGIFITGTETINYYLAIYIVSGIIFAVIIGYLLRILVLKRLGFLNHQIQDIVAHQDYSRRIPISHHDELTLVAKQFNKMMEMIQDSYQQLENQVNELSMSEQRLAKTNKQLQSEINDRKEAESKVAALNNKLITAARRAGMVDIVSGILHNIGNILNSVITSIAITQERAEHSKSEKLTHLVQLFNEHHGDLEKFLTTNQKGEKSLRYLGMLANSWTDDNKKLLHEISELTINVGHIKNIITMQQSLGKIVGVTEEVDLIKLIEDALLLNRLLYENTDIKINCDYQFTGQVIIDRVKLLHVFVNLIKNSIDSLLKSDNPAKEIIIRVQKTDEEYFTIHVIDNGLGILADNITKIFAYGFTTKKSGHGYGLHASATFIQEMDGKLYAESEGLNKGATFVIILPIKPLSGGSKRRISENQLQSEWEL